MQNFIFVSLFLFRLLANFVRSEELISNTLEKRKSESYLEDSPYFDDLTSRYMNNEKLTPEEFKTLKDVLNMLENDLATHHDLIPQRSKKYKQIQDKINEKDEETIPLFNHKRKNVFTVANNERYVEELARKSGLNKPGNCVAQTKAEPNVIIDSKKSIAKGAKLLNIDYISRSTASMRLNSLQESCMDICCGNPECDTGLLSMKIGEVRFIF